MDGAKLTRRGSIVGFGGLLLGLLGWKASSSEGAGPAAVASGAVSCVLTPEQTEGPYYIAGEKLRRNITEGRPGVPLLLRLRVVDASTCRPIKGAAVDIWHADALGVYSGFGARCAQPHVHARDPADRQDGPRALPQRLPRLVPGPHGAHPRQGARRRERRPHGPALLPGLADGQGLPAQALQPAGKRTTRNANDFVFAQGGRRSLLRLRKAGSAYVGSITMGVNRS